MKNYPVGNELNDREENNNDADQTVNVVFVEFIMFSFLFCKV